MKAIRVSERTQELMREAAKKVAVDSKGEVTTINGSLAYILTLYLGKK